MMGRFQQVYCGPAPAPEALWSSWNLDPWLLGVLATAASAYLLSRKGRLGREDASAVLGFGVLVVAFVSPLCALTSALFAARVVHHALLILVAAPLLALAWRTERGSGLGLAAAAVLHAIILWVWHAPAPYAWALSSDAGYWLMQLSLLASAAVFWRAILAASALGAAMALVFTMAQMGLLGALIALAPEAVYAPHFVTTAAWGLTALEDQQIAGLIMWAPMAGLYLLVALARLLPMLSEAPAPQPGR
ncbi:cytochrome c oxidase assembly protein [Brevundimonas sp.]|uniref:cytochrome c oxidase assembly protein n=1 Tax=Brevundimonas sp. TaxID=1871086 RepID=UPI0025EDE5B2|nr:cytochrome c oxidase assembly protein [Brevundimonas sp.]